MKLWFILLGALTTLAAGNGFLIYRERKIARTRGAHSLDDFVASFSGEEMPRRILVEVYGYFRSLQSVKDFPVHPTDNLYKVYGVGNEDLDDAVLELAQRCGAKTPVTEDLQDMPAVQTVADIVRLLASLPAAQ